MQATLCLPRIQQCQALRTNARLKNKRGRVERANGNAVLLENGIALTAGHCAPEPGTGGKIWLEGKPAKVLMWTESLALIRVPPSLRTGKPVTVAKEKAPSGDFLTHRWYSHDDLGCRVRPVFWTSSGAREGFLPGMSGSGIYNASGELVAVAELQNGFAWDLATIRSFLQKYTNANVCAA